MVVRGRTLYLTSDDITPNATLTERDVRKDTLSFSYWKSDAYRFIASADKVWVCAGAFQRCFKNRMGPQGNLEWRVTESFSDEYLQVIKNTWETL